MCDPRSSLASHAATTRHNSRTTQLNLSLLSLSSPPLALSLPLAQSQTLQTSSSQTRTTKPTQTHKKMKHTRHNTSAATTRKSFELHPINHDQMTPKDAQFEPFGDWAGLDSTRLDSTGLDWTGQDWTRLDWTRETRLAWTRVDWTGPDWTRQDWTRPD